MYGQEAELILCALKSLNRLTIAEIGRVLSMVKGVGEYDPQTALAQMVQAGLLKQSIGIGGVVYLLTEDGEKALEASGISPELRRDVQAKAEALKAVFEEEQNYPAQYTEQSNKIVPVFLSIRKDEKVLLKVSVIVNDIPTAVQVKENWMKNAHKAYEALWDAIGEGEPMPKF